MIRNLLRIGALTLAIANAWVQVGTCSDVKLDVAATLTQGPGGLSVIDDGGLVVSLHPFFETRERLIRIDRNGEWNPFPSIEMSSGEPGRNSIALDSVIAVHSAEDGTLWLLDNGRRSESTPKLIAWNLDKNEIRQVIYLPSPATIDTSFLADFAIDPAEPFIYIADPAGGQDAALIVVDLSTGVSRRVLGGHLSVTPEAIPLTVQGKTLVARRVDGSGAEPMAGVNPITVDRRGRTLYFGPMKGLRLYKIETDKLRDPGLPAEELNQAVAYYAVKPICDSITIDAKNNIYAADLSLNAITVIRPNSLKPEIYIQDPRLCWPDGLCFGPDGRLYFFCSQVNRTVWFNGGVNHAEAPFTVFRIKPIHQPLLTNPLPKNPFSGISETITETISERLRGGQ